MHSKSGGGKNYLQFAFRQLSTDKKRKSTGKTNWLNIFDNAELSNERLDALTKRNVPKSDLKCLHFEVKFLCVPKQNFFLT